MEERRIIQSGPGSYVVTLPIDWIRKNKFEKGSVVYIKEDTTNSVVVYPKFKEISREQREISIDASTFSTDELNNNIISSYLNNSKRISIKNLKDEHIPELKRLVSVLPGLNIVEQSRNVFIIEDILDVDTVNVTQTIRRIDMMLRNMMTSVINNEEAHISDVDYNIFGQSLFIKRMLKYALRDPAVMATIELNAERIIEYMMIADQLENISNKIKNISNEKISKQQRSEYLKIFKMMNEQYLNAMKSFHNNDRVMATIVFKTKKTLYDTLKSIKSYNHNINTECILFDKSCRIIARIVFDKWNEEKI